MKNYDVFRQELLVDPLRVEFFKLGVVTAASAAHALRIAKQKGYWHPAVQVQM
jgi:uncharacterized protein YegL